VTRRTEPRVSWRSNVILSQCFRNRNTELDKDCARGRTARQCHQGLQETCGESALPYRTVARWVGILQAVDRYIRTINTTGAAKGILHLHIAGNGLYTMLVTTLKDSKTSKHASILYQL
jgi:hypothetical protein